jgi:SH3-like domain-containing protein
MITTISPGRSSFDASLRFVVARAGDCVNLRDAPSLESEVHACLVDGAPLTLWESATGSGLEDNVAFVRNTDGAWVAVRTPDGATGWVSSAYLDWA